MNNKPSYPATIRFLPGRVMSTRGAISLLMRSGTSAFDLLRRHITGDWGDIDATDREANDLAVVLGLRILSSYRLQVPYPDSMRTGEEVVWLITEADRSVTTFLLPEEY